MPSPSPALTKLLSPLCSDAWVECDSCQIWRRVPKNVSDRLGDDEQWCVRCVLTRPPSRSKKN
jgi:histone-lysine N-methyltransferase SETD2